MDLTRRELDDLARFFSKRFPGWEERARLAESAGVASEAQLSGPSEEAWQDILRLSTEKGTLGGLARAALARRPGDENMADVARLLCGEGRRWGWKKAALGIGALAALGLGVAIFISMGADPEVASLADVELDETPAPAGGDPEVVSQPVEAEDAAPVAELAPTAEPAPTAEQVAEVPDHEAAASSLAAAEPPGQRVRRCADMDPGQVAWWFAGGESPGSVGSVLTIDGGVNVREAYPSADNSWNSRAPLVCVLGHGTRVRISDEPVFVPGGAWWVPFRAPDLDTP